jgi:hypothetical protein
MADPAMSVSPYWELTFDADGDVDQGERDRLLSEVRQRGVSDLIVFSHGWNSRRAGATQLYSRFFAPIPRLAPKARIGYVGVIWPSMEFPDQPIPDFPRSTAAATGPTAPAALDADTRHALLDTFPGKAPVIDQIARMLEQQPPQEAELEEFARTRWRRGCRSASRGCSRSAVRPRCASSSRRRWPTSRRPSLRAP